MPSEQQLVDDYNRRHPKRPVQGLLSYITGGLTTRKSACALCGWQSPEWCGHYPKPRSVIRAEFAHIESHIS